MAQGIATDVLVVGAGMAGLTAARVLQEQGKRVLLVDKGRCVGGRMATREVDGGIADYGAQFFTVREPEFGSLVARWLAEGIVFEWSRGWSDGSLATTHVGHPRYAVRGGMGALAQRLAQGLNVRVNFKLTAIRRIDGGWLVEDESGSITSAESLLLTPPVPRSLALIEASGIELAEADHAALNAIEYQSNLTGLFALDREVRLPSPGAIQRPHANIHWIADNHRKGISPGAVVLTAQAGAVYSRQLWDSSDDAVLTALKTDLMPILGDAKIIEVQLKRWRYAAPIACYPDRCLVAADQPAPLVFAGDAFGSPNIEGAALSGLAAGQALLDALN